MHRICRRGLRQPVAVAGIAPISDLRLTNGSLRTNLGSDHLVPMRWIRRGRRAYLDGHDPRDPEVSPVLGTFNGAPPCLLHVDQTEILFDDSKALADRLRDQGVATEVPVFKGRSHVWHLNVGRCPKADSSVSAIGSFIKKQAAKQLS
ncbi:MAG: alpha/beta hydrolase fold domain-containing protein [Devosiaceae bacterium]|nr:alpha/beta hydrolase fold domain-containing protein [Devosiaceae bacterium MH13]